MTHQLRSHRLACVAAAFVIGLTACGSASTADPAGSATAVTAAQLAVITLASGGTSVPAAAVSGEMAGDSKMMAPFSVVYSYSGPAIDLTAPAASWFFPADSIVTPEQVAQVAAAFGVAGDVRPMTADSGASFAVGPVDYNDGATVTVSNDAMASWWYSPAPMNSAMPVCATEGFDPNAERTPASTSPTPVVCEPTLPANVPSPDEALASAKAVLTTLGVDLTKFRVESSGDDWGAYVTATLVLEGVPTNLSISIGYGAEGAITWASGFLGQPQRGGDYPRIGIDAAVQRLTDQSAQWMYPMGRGDGVMPTDDMAVQGVAVGTNMTGYTPVSGSDQPIAAALPATTPMPVDSMPVDSMPVESLPVEPMPVDSMPVEPMPVDQMPIQIELTAATPSLEQVWAEDGTVWLLPGYQFNGADGGLYSVIAIEDQYLAQADPPTNVGEPATTMVVGTDPDAPSVTAAVDPAAPLSLEEVAALVIGRTVAEAEAIATDNGFTVRVVRIDGADQPTTMDYRFDRYNVAIELGTILEVLNNG